MEEQDLMIDVESMMSVVDHLPPVTAGASLEDFYRSMPAISLNAIPIGGDLDTDAAGSVNIAPSPLPSFGLNMESVNTSGIGISQNPKRERRRQQIKLASRRCRLRKKQGMEELKKRVQVLERELKQQQKMNALGSDRERIKVEITEDAVREHPLFKDLQDQLESLKSENTRLKENLNDSANNNSEKTFKEYPIQESSVHVQHSKYQELAEKTYSDMSRFDVLRGPSTIHMQVLDWNLNLLHEGSMMKYSSFKFFARKNIEQEFDWIVEKAFQIAHTESTPEIMKARVLHKFNENALLLHRVETLSPHFQHCDLVTLVVKQIISESKTFIGLRSVDLEGVEVEDGCIRGEECSGISLTKVEQGDEVGLFVEFQGYLDCKKTTTRQQEYSMRVYFLLLLLRCELEMEIIE